MTVKNLMDMLNTMNEEEEFDEYELHRLMNEEAEFQAERFSELEWRSLENSWQDDIIDMYRYER